MTAACAKISRLGRKRLEQWLPFFPALIQHQPPQLPGIRPEDVEVTADNGVLTVRGQKNSERKEGDDQSRYHLVERSYGTFTRSFQLPQGLDESKIEADIEHGILSIRIPKAALPQPRKIQIGKQVSGKGTNDVLVQKQQNASSGSQNATRQSPESTRRDTATAGAH